MEPHIYNYLIQKELRSIQAPKTNGLIVCISRNFGVQARKPIENLIDKLNKNEVGYSLLRRPWKLVDYTILHNIAKELKVGIQELNEFTPIEHKGIIEQMMYGLDFKRNKLDEKLSDALKTVIYSFFERGNVVFLGRGATSFTAGIPNAMNIRVHASEAYRIRQYATSNDLDLGYARERVKRKDKKRKQFLNYISQTVPIPFDLEIDREELSDLTLTECLFSFVRSKENELLHNV
ncbi:cytidylate kinase family protein [Flammeovirga sp. SubArs3]|uniref:cytidylate kinase-like family protein n=1 Tax=Flammeovirga sp. SubArs3 TaxID=2995316 RepID=UPI00248B8773|nr:cytidylate kinase family protein [Flammeovirga sp. SubArs3]